MRVVTSADGASPSGPPGRGTGPQSRWVDIDGPVHYLDFGGPQDGPVVVGVHGLGGSCVNWAAIAPLITTRCRMLAPDLAGHGLTESLGRGTAVRANQVLLDRFIEAVPSRPVILMGNSMGGMLSLLEAAAVPEAVTGLVLLDAALPLVPSRPDPLVAAAFATYAMPGLGHFVMKRRRASPAESQVSMVLRLCCVDMSRVPAEVVARHVEVARTRARFVNIERDFLAAARSVLTMAGLVGGFAYRRAIRSVRAPVLLVHGEKDRLVPVQASRAIVRRNPAWPLVVLPDVGHVPQLEAPAETAEAFFRWLDGAGRAAASAATHPSSGMR